jgi:hypothetical protein
MKTAVYKIPKGRKNVIEILGRRYKVRRLKGRVLLNGKQFPAYINHDDGEIVAGDAADDSAIHAAIEQIRDRIETIERTRREQAPRKRGGR